MFACSRYGVPVRVWSNRGLHKKDFHGVPVKESAFDLVIQPGEPGAEFAIERAKRPGRKVTTPPVTLLKRDELLNRDEARDSLGLKRDGRYVLFSLGPGNLKDVSHIARGLIEEFNSHGFTVVWACAPISVRDMVLPDDVIPISVFPLVRYMRAFDAFTAAAGYNTCCEVLQAGVPTLLVPNTMVADDQNRRSEIVTQAAPAVVSPCETIEERRDAVARLLTLDGCSEGSPDIDLDGAERAVDEVLALLTQKAAA